MKRNFNVGDLVIGGQFTDGHGIVLGTKEAGPAYGLIGSPPRIVVEVFWQDGRTTEVTDSYLRLVAKGKEDEI